MKKKRNRYDGESILANLDVHTPGNRQNNVTI